MRKLAFLLILLAGCNLAPTVTPEPAGGPWAVTHYTGDPGFRAAHYTSKGPVRLSGAFVSFTDAQTGKQVILSGTVAIVEQK